MDAKARILALRLMEMIRQKSLRMPSHWVLKWILKPASMAENGYLHAEGLTELSNSFVILQIQTASFGLDL